MGADHTQQSEQLQILVSEDHLNAWICHPSITGPGYEPPQATDVLHALESANIAIDDAVRLRVEQYAALMSPLAEGESAGGPPEIPEKFLIAEGKAPVEAEDGTFKWHEKYAPAEPLVDDEESIDFFSLISIFTVEADVAIGRIKPPREGLFGQDVFGNDLPPQQCQGVAIEVGEGLRLGEDGSEVITENAGRVVNKLGRLVLEEVLDIAGDVDFETGNLDVCVDVNVKGTVLSNFCVKTTKSLTVHRAVEAANVQVDGDLTVDGGLCGGNAADQSTGRVQAGGCLTARFCNDTIASAGGEIRIEKETLNSRVRAEDRLITERGAIIGGFVSAREAIEASVLGSDAGVVTYVAVGVPPEVLQRASRMEADMRRRAKSAKRIREKIQPLMANLKRLNPQQREMTTELMSKADEMEMAVETIQAQREQMLVEAQPKGKPHILVHRTIYPGVRLLVSGRETRIRMAVPGPVKIEERKVEGATELVYVNQRTSSVTVLPSTDVDLEALPADESEPAGGKDGTE